RSPAESFQPRLRHAPPSPSSTPPSPSDAAPPPRNPLTQTTCDSMHASDKETVAIISALESGVLAEKSLTYAMTARKGRLTPRVFFAATLVAAAILIAIVAIPQWLSKQARLNVQ